MTLLLGGGLAQPPVFGVHTVEAAVPPAVVPAPPPGTISGLVTDDRGAPLAGVQVQVQSSFPRIAQTGPDGRYTVGGLADGSYRVVVDTGPSANPVSGSLVPYPSLVNVTSLTGQTGVDFVVPRPAIITGAVRDEAGRPIPNARIGGIQIFPFVSSGPDGHYLARVAPGPRTITASADGYVGSFGPGDPSSANPTNVDPTAGQLTTADFVLDAGGAISGRVLFTSGQPVAGAFVSATHTDPVTGRSYGASTATDQSGSYVMGGLIPGDYVVNVPITRTSPLPVVYFPGTLDATAATPVTVADAVTTPAIDFALAPVTQGPPITVTSISPQVFTRGTTTTATLIGTGFVLGATVGIQTFGEPPQPDVSFVDVLDSEHVLVTVTVPADASFAQGGLFIGQLGQFADCFCGPFVADPGSAFGTISGRVTRSSDGAPVANVQVSALTPAATQGEFRSISSTAADGSYQLGPLPAGDYVVRFSPPGFLPGSLTTELYPDAKTDAGATPVTVTADADTPNIDAALEARTTSPSIASVSPSALTPGTTTDVTITGSGFNVGDSFSISSGGSPSPTIAVQRIVSSTEVLATVVADPLTPSGPRSINVFPGSGGFGGQCNCLSVVSPAESVGTVSGAVTDPAGNGLGNIHVTAVAAGGTAVASTAWTGPDGIYALRLPSGDYSLHFEDLAGAAADVPATAVVGQFAGDVNATITPLASIGSLSGTVTDTFNLNLRDILVQAANIGTGAVSATLTDGFGAYHFPTLDAGDYVVEFSGPGFQTSWYNGAADAASATPVTVVAGAETPGIDAALSPDRRPLSVTSVSPNRVAQGETLQATISGAGFAFGGVANLSFTAGDGVSIAVIDASPDSAATVSITVDPEAALGPRDVVATRDDGQQATCAACLRVFAALGSISGSVASATATPLFFPSVTATAAGTGEVFTTQPSPAGGYSFDRLPADDYVVQFSSPGFVTEWYDNADSATTATPVTVGAAPVIGIDATLQPGRRSLFLNFMSPSILQQGTTTDVTVSGSGFLDGGVTGLSFDGGPGVSVQVTSVASDTTANVAITVAADAALGQHPFTATRDDGAVANCPFCLQVSPARGRITGRVTGPAGTTLPFGTVVVYAAGAAVPTAFASVQPDSTYTVDNLLPGDYQVEFFSSFGFDTEWWNDVRTQAEATTITVAGGQTVTGIDAELTVPSSPLRLDQGFPSYQAFQGTSHAVTFFGSGFLDGVTGLTFSAGPGIAITVDSVPFDTLAHATITADAAADLGFRDIVASRGDGQTWTCSQCLQVVPAPPGDLFGFAADADTGASIFGTVTVTKVGDVAPTQSQFFFGNFFLFGLPAGDYDLTIDAAGYEQFTSRVTVVAGQPTFLNDIHMLSIRQPLTFTGPTPLAAFQGFAEQYVVSGSGFRSGAVTGLAFSAGPDVTITVDTVLSDNAAQITIDTATAAVPGLRDLTVTRDDGQVVVCTGCVVVSAPPPGSVTGVVLSSDTFDFIPATITATLVGDPTPVTSISAFGPFTLSDLAAGDYDLLFESTGFISTTQRVTVRPAETTSVTAVLDLPRQPLSVTSVSPAFLNQGSFFETLQVNGSGFRAGGVTGLTATVGPDVVVQFVSVQNDSQAILFVAVPADATVGTFDVVMSRDPGETAACLGCVTVREPPAFIQGFISDAECCGAVAATVTATKVGDTVPTAMTFALGSYGLEVPAGDYIIEVDADGYLSQWWDHAPSAAAATAVSVTPGEFRFGIDFALTPRPNALRLDGVAIDGVVQGETQSIFVIGNGFQRGGVTGLRFTAGTGVTISVDGVFSDQVAQVTVSVADAATLGPRDLVATRDDASVAICSGCLVIVRGQPLVTSVSPTVVREGKRTITVSGQHLQSVVNVGSSSKRVDVTSFENRPDGSVTVDVKVGSRPRATFTLTFTRDDGTTFSADFSVGR